MSWNYSLPYPWIFLKSTVLGQSTLALFFFALSPHGHERAAPSGSQALPIPMTPDCPDCTTSNTLQDSRDSNLYQLTRPYTILQWMWIDPLRWPLARTDNHSHHYFCLVCILACYRADITLTATRWCSDKSAIALLFPAEREHET